MTIPKLTDDAVASMPLQTARAELLEEIMSTEAPSRTTPLTPAPARRRLAWAAPLAAAAVVAGIAGTSLLWDGDSTKPSSKPDTAVAADPGAAPRQYAVLDAPGWTVKYTESSGDYGSASYENGKSSFEITTYAAESYDSYVEDREHITEPPAPGAPVQVLGQDAQMWAYSADDHAAIRTVEDGHWMEFRGQGMDETAYVALLGQLKQVSLDQFEASLPDKFVTGDERLDTALEMLSGITTASGAEWPAGNPGTVESQQQDPYQLGAEVAGAYACAWLKEFETATNAGDTAAATEAARVLGTSRDWPVLQQMNAEGDYPEVVWDYADQVAAGTVPQGFRDGLGCD